VSAQETFSITDGAGDTLEVRDSHESGDVVVQVNDGPAVIVSLGDLDKLVDKLREMYHRRERAATSDPEPGSRRISVVLPEGINVEQFRGAMESRIASLVTHG
jgi:hypothetical protein